MKGRRRRRGPRQGPQMDLWEQVAPQLSKEGGECQPPHKAAGIRRTSLFGGKRCKWVNLHGLGRAILWVDLPYVAILWVDVDCEACHIVGGCCRQATIVVWTLNGSSVDNRKQATKKCSVLKKFIKYKFSFSATVRAPQKIFL